MATETIREQGGNARPGLTSEQVWRAVANASFAVLSHVTPGGILSLVVPIPPATISFHGTAAVHPAGSPQARSLLDELGSLVPAERRAEACVVEIIPAGAFRTFGTGVSLRTILNPAAAQACVPVTPDQDTR
jgi:hypothetical protein